MNKDLNKKLYDSQKEKLTNSIKTIKETYPYVIVSEKFQNLSNDVIIFRNTIEKIIKNSSINTNKSLKELFENILEYMDEIISENCLDYVDKCKMCDSDLESIIRDIKFEEDFYFSDINLDELENGELNSKDSNNIDENELYNKDFLNFHKNFKLNRKGKFVYRTDNNLDLSDYFTNDLNNFDEDFEY